MTAVECILDGLEAELALERELGVRVFECDRALLKAEPPEPPVPAVRAMPVESDRVPEATKPRSGPKLVFLHDRPLSEGGVAMLAKIVLALGFTAETAPLIVTQPVPRARVYVVLGGLALRKFLPGEKGVPGQWIRSPQGADVLVTYSPEYILRFQQVDETVQKLKRQMWNSLKGILQRPLRSSESF